jgi:hypothetical protein
MGFNLPATALKKTIERSSSRFPMPQGEMNHVAELVPLRDP